MQVPANYPQEAEVKSVNDVHYEDMGAAGVIVYRNGQATRCVPLKAWLPLLLSALTPFKVGAAPGEVQP